MIPIPKSGNRLRSCGWSRDQVAQSAFARGPAAAEARGCGELRCPQDLPFTGMPDSKIAGPDDVLEIFEWRG